MREWVGIALCVALAVVGVFVLRWDVRHPAPERDDDDDWGNSAW